MQKNEEFTMLFSKNKNKGHLALFLAINSAKLPNFEYALHQLNIF